MSAQVSTQYRTQKDADDRRRHRDEASRKSNQAGSTEEVAGYSFRIDTSQERLCWLDVGQVAAKASILAALKVIHEKQQGSLEEKIVRRDKKGLVRVKQCQKTS